MKRQFAIEIVGLLLVSFSGGSDGQSCCFISSHVSPPSETTLGVGRMSGLSIQAMRAQMNHQKIESFPSTCSSRTNAYISDRLASKTHGRGAVVCHLNKDNNTEDGEKEQSPKRGLFKRLREKFGGNKKGDQSEGDAKIGYKPNPLDGIRLRLARAMSSVNLPFQFGNKEDWVVACPKTQVGPGQIVPCTVNGLDIIIFASRDGSRLDAFANACPHLGSPFDLATVERKPPMQDTGRTNDVGTGDGCVDCIVCPVHRTAFEIESGQVRGEWCPYPPIIGNVMGFAKPKTDLVKFAVRLKGKNVEVRIATSVKNVGKGDEQADGMRGIK